MRKHRRETSTDRSVAVRPPEAAGTSAALPPGPPLVGGASRLGGYRLVRVLGEGASAVVHLGYADAAADDEPRRTAALKIFRAHVTPERIDAEVAALAAAAHPHVVGLVDLASTDDGRLCLILERCGAGGLGHLVATRANIAAGEAVTILAPIIAATHALHAAGYVHRDIRLSHVLFRESGAPVLASLGSSARIAPALSPAALASNVAVLDDRRQLTKLVAGVLERVDDSRAQSLHDWLSAAHEGDDDYSERLTDAVFDLAEPQPVRLRDAVPDGTARVVRPRRAPAPEEHRARSPTAMRECVVIVVRSALEWARGVRRGVWLAAGGVALSLVVAVFAVPAGPAGESGPHQHTRPAPSPSATPHEPSGDAGEGDDAVQGDDPLAAVLALLDRRERCVHELSVLCLDGVTQSGSGAMQRDSALIRALQAGAEISADDTIVAGTPVLVQRLGDSALLDLGDVPLTQPASALVMRGEAGWRIRDYLDESTSGG